jgi:hypothetical protein
MLADHELLGSLDISKTPRLLGKSCTRTVHSILCRIDILRSHLSIRLIFREKLNNM